MLRFETISSEQLDQLVGNPHVEIVDVRKPEEYRKEHISGAINIPYEQLKKNDVLKKTKLLVFYCTHGGTGLLAAKEFFDKGFVVKALVGGIEGYHGNNKVFDRSR